MARTREEIREERRRLRAEYGALFDGVAALLFRLDPVGISSDGNEDEYEPEAGTIVPRLKRCGSEGEVLRVVHEEFVRWFDEGTAGPQEHYKQVAAQIWSLSQKHEAALKRDIL
jgi:hypothetical protein